MTMVTYIDPPSGWRYGFPKAIPDPKPEDMRKWLVENGYPQWEIDKMGKNFYCRYWQGDQDEQEKTSN